MSVCLEGGELAIAHAAVLLLDWKLVEGSRLTSDDDAMGGSGSLFRPKNFAANTAKQRVAMMKVIL